MMEENNEEFSLDKNIIEGYAFVDNDMRILCCDSEQTLVMIPWSTDLVQDDIMVFWFGTTEELEDYIESNDLWLKIYKVSEEVKNLIKLRELEPVKIEKNTKTKNVYIV